MQTQNARLFSPPRTITRILAPVDFSPFSRHALAFAGLLAGRVGAELTVVHAAPASESGPSRPRLLKQLNDLIAPLATAGVTPRIVIGEGDPVTEILAQSLAIGADLIVMGTHGRRGFDRFILGSVSERVLHKAGCPVAIVPRDSADSIESERPIRTILCADDLEDATGARAYAFSLAHDLGARVVVLHAIEELPEAAAEGGVPFEYGPVLMREAAERVRSAISADDHGDLPIDATVVAGRAYKQILLRAEQEQADLIVMGAHGRSPINLMFFGSTAHHVVRAGHCPVLTVRGERIRRNDNEMSSTSKIEETRG